MVWFWTCITTIILHFVAHFVVAQLFVFKRKDSFQNGIFLCRIATGHKVKFL